MAGKRWERNYRDKEVVVGNKYGRLPKAPHEPIAGFVPIVPGRRDLDHNIESVSAAVDRAADDGRSRVTLSYEPHYRANYYGLRRALGEELARIRGGWFEPLDGQFTLVVEFVVRNGENPVGYRQPKRSRDWTHRYDIDNMTKTFLDALVHPWADVVPKDSPTARRGIRTIVDDDRIVKLDAQKHAASWGEMPGVWFALDEIAPDEDAAEAATRLTELLDKAKAERRASLELREFDRRSLDQAKEDGDAFLAGCGLQPVGRPARAVWIGAPFGEVPNPVDPALALTEEQFLSLLGH